MRFHPGDPMDYRTILVDIDPPGRAAPALMAH
jgi:hypothetical protein